MDLKFGEFQLKTRQRELVGPSGAVPLSDRSLDILRTLLTRPNELVEKPALFDAVWPGVVVEENTLQVHISALRKALGSDVIATVHGRGYKYAGMQGPLRLKSFSQTPHPPRARPVSR